MSHIFISYSRKNQEYARRLADHLLALGFDVWIDDQIDYGDKWHRVIFKAIDECAAFIVIMSPESRESDWVEKEYLYAEELNKPVFPLLLQGARFPYFVNKQFVDVRSGDLPRENLYTQIERVAPRKASQGEEIKAEQTPTQIKQPTIKKIESRVYDILPAPFEWIEIPEGEVTFVNRVDDDPQIYLKKDEPKTFGVLAFIIAKYPVTNAQYSKFINAGGYQETTWWTEIGWQIRSKEQWTEPRHWGNHTWNRATHPVIGISWYEAVAFCNWLSIESGEEITLPSEQQWQRAAQGNDGRIYPWGNEWDGAFCNNNVPPFRSSYTTPVNEFEGRGNSPFGVVDMIGNIWEWCLSTYYKGNNKVYQNAIRVLRGDLGEMIMLITFV